MSKKVYIFLADGFEDIEGLTVVDLLRRAEIDIKTVSIKETRQIQTSHGITMLTDTTFAETDFTDADMLVLPGGMPGTKYLAGYKPLTDLLTDFNSKGKKNRRYLCCTKCILRSWIPQKPQSHLLSVLHGNYCRRRCQDQRRQCGSRWKYNHQPWSGNSCRLRTFPDFTA